MAAAETRHADHMEKMKGIIIGNPERFSTGPPFNPAGLKTVMAGIRDHHEKSNARLIPRERFLILTRDIERSVLAAHYAGIVRTDDSAYLTIMTEILKDTEGHRKARERRLAS